MDEYSLLLLIWCSLSRYVNLPRDHPESYYSFMWGKFFSHIDIKYLLFWIRDFSGPRMSTSSTATPRIWRLSARPMRLRSRSTAVSSSSSVALVLMVTLHSTSLAPLSPLVLVSRPSYGPLLLSHSQAYDTIVANSRFFDNDINKVPKTALTVGVGTIMDAKEVVIIINGSHKAYALAKCVEEGVSHMWTVSMLQVRCSLRILGISRCILTLWLSAMRTPLLSSASRPSSTSRAFRRPTTTLVTPLLRIKDIPPLEVILWFYTSTPCKPFFVISLLLFCLSFDALFFSVVRIFICTLCIQPFLSWSMV